MEGIHTNWDQIEGKWKQMKGSIREKWADLTDSDIEAIGGSKDKFVGKLQERYGYSKERAERDLDDWASASRHEEAPRTRTSGGY